MIIQTSHFQYFNTSKIDTLQIRLITYHVIHLVYVDIEWPLNYLALLWFTSRSLFFIFFKNSYLLNRFSQWRPVAQKTDSYLHSILNLQRCTLISSFLNPGGLAVAVLCSVRGIICPPGLNRVNWSAKFRGGGLWLPWPPI